MSCETGVYLCIHWREHADLNKPNRPASFMKLGSEWWLFWCLLPFETSKQWELRKRLAWMRLLRQFRQNWAAFPQSRDTYAAYAWPFNIIMLTLQSCRDDNAQYLRDYRRERGCMSISRFKTVDCRDYDNIVLDFLAVLVHNTRGEGSICSCCQGCSYRQHRTLSRHGKNQWLWPLEALAGV